MGGLFGNIFNHSAGRKKKLYLVTRATKSIVNYINE